ncbi:MAG: DUF5916 domain-containing protein [Bacteroidota bacterium]
MKRFLPAFFAVSLSLISILGFSQNKPGTGLSIKKVKNAIKLDGVLDEPDWQIAEIAKDFFMNYPVDTIAPTFPSEVRVAFDEHFLYFGIICYDDQTPHIVQSLRRDIEWERNDNVGIYFDPFDDFTNGFYFTITPMGVQSEGIISGGGAIDDSYNNNWDNKWYSKVSRFEDRWVAELAIPFKSIRYNLGNWNMTFVRNDLKRNQVSSWIATPIQYIPASFNYAGKLTWQDPPPHPHTNISFIPYISGAASKDKENDKPSEGDFNAGFDAKVGLTPSINLDLTVNPDFSQVEVDRQVINLTRFEFGFPERRQFFLENNDLFANPGFPDTRPFFSRRLGLAVDSANKIQRVPILYGARVSGKIGSKWRIGAMNLQTREKEEMGLPAQNYSIAVVQRQIFSRSNIGFVMVNKQSLGIGSYDPTRYYHKSVLHEEINGTDTLRSLNKFNRVYGVDFNLYSKDNRWIGDIYYHRSADSFSEDKNYCYGAFIGYSTRHFEFQTAQQGIGKNYNAESGFVPGLDVYPGYFSGFAQVTYRSFPKKSSIVVLEPSVAFDYVMTPDGKLTDRSFGGEYEINFFNTSRVEVGFRNVFQKLPEDFNPLDPDGDSTLLAGQSFTWNEGRIEYQSDTRKVFNYQLNAGYGGFYNGTLFNVGGELNYRYQPYGSLSVLVDYNDLRFPAAFGETRFLLIGPRLDLTFTDKLFLTTFVQYNDRSENVNLNARFQWRFKPASDFFIVYTENYISESLKTKNRALVLKLTYWLNL